jgi:hypothetical protein
MSGWGKWNFDSNYFPVAKGQVAGHEYRNIFGFASGIGTSFTTPWELASTTAYAFPASALQMTLASSSASDTAVVVRINGLDADYNPISELVELDGTNGVTTTNNYRRINDLITTSGNAVGNITAKNSTTTYAQITAGKGRNQAALYTVPAGHTLFLTRIDAFSATATGNKYLTFQNKNTWFNGTVYQVAETTFLNEMKITRQVPFPITEKTDLEFQVKFSSSTGEVGIFGEGILVDNRYL